MHTRIELSMELEFFFPTPRIGFVSVLIGGGLMCSSSHEITMRFFRTLRRDRRDATQRFGYDKCRACLILSTVHYISSPKTYKLSLRISIVCVIHFTAYNLFSASAHTSSSNVLIAFSVNHVIVVRGQHT